MIKVENLKKSYGQFQALNDVSFEINKGEIVGLLGHNGAGKTTLMRIITGYIPASDGKAYVDGMDVFEEPKEVKKKIGYLPESCPLYTEMTVTDFLISMAQLKGVKKKNVKQRLEYVLEAVQIKDKRHSIINTLSKGYKQRVGLAQSLIHDPNVLILDEPTVGLDPAQIIEIRELIRKQKNERTVILSTHILPEVSQTCEKIIIISKGQIAEQGTEQEIINRMSNNQRIQIQVGNDAEKAREIIGSTSGVLDVKGNTSFIDFELEKGKDLRSQIAKSLIEQGIELNELRSEQMTLEDIFIRLTHQV